LNFKLNKLRRIRKCISQQTEEPEERINSIMTQHMYYAEEKKILIRLIWLVC